jgi:hypothetical protein
MTIAAQEGHVQGFLIIPVVAFQLLIPSAPGTALGPPDQAELFREGRGVASGPRAESPRFFKVLAKVEMATETCEFLGLTIPSGSLHVT